MTDDRPCTLCSRPLADWQTFDDHCADQLHRALGDIPWLTEQLEVTATGSKGIDYRTLANTSSGDPAEAPMPINLAATNAHDNLKQLLVSWTKLCHEENLPHQSPSDDLPDDNLPAISRWLMWRINALQHHDAGPDVVEEITGAVRRAHKVIDKQPPRQYLGVCSVCHFGVVYALYDGSKAWCTTCDQLHDANEIRDAQLDALKDRNLTAAQIADLTHIGLGASRETVRKRIMNWANRGRINPVGDGPVYRFGDVYDQLTEGAS